MSTCKSLAARYTKEVPILPDKSANVIPAVDATYDEKDKWMLISRWGCLVPPATVPNMNREDCIANEPPNDPNVTVNQRRPALNYLQESGFLSWVNDRGLKCVNKITGTYYGMNMATGLANTPGPTTSPLKSQCAGACRSVTADSAMCFECINQVLATDPSICDNAVNPNNPDDINLIQQAVSCHTCIASQGEFIPLQPVTSPAKPNNTAIMNNMFQCVTGTLAEPLSITIIAIIVIVVVVAVTVAIVLGVYFGVIQPKLKKKHMEDQQLRDKGYDPDDI